MGHSTEYSPLTVKKKNYNSKLCISVILCPLLVMVIGYLKKYFKLHTGVQDAAGK